MEIKKNDWVATLFFNQDRTLQELADLGFTVDNSDIKDQSYYKSKPEIQQAFMKENGDFDEVKFNNFYNSALKLYNDEDVKKIQTDLLNNYEYDPDDLLAPIGSKTWDKPTEIVHYANPRRQSRGIKNLNQMGDPTMSEREVGQMNKIFNPETGEFESKTPNDLNLWNMITGKSLVLASWDEDGVHEVDGRMIHHKKGELKYNDEGDTYYEYLNGRSLSGKELLHATDILTIDGSNWNKYDFFDSDGLDKSAFGTVMKTAVTIAPSFIPYVGGAYAVMGIALELGKFLPELYKSIDGIITNDSSNNKVANRIEAWASRFDYSISDRGKSKMFSFENINNMVSSSSMQLIQQRMISKIPAMINSGKYSENAIKWGRALSLSYMAGTSSTDTFEAFKEAGTSDRVAGLGAIASVFAMKKLMDNDYFRDFWYNGTPLARKEFKKAIKDAATEVQKSIDIATVTKNTENQKNFINKTIKSIVSAFNKATSKAVISSALNEGIEETGEEIVFDTIKGISSALNGLGLFDKNSEYNFGFSVENMLSRYATSFLGGAIGGTTFHYYDKINNSINNVAKDVADKKGFDELIYLIRNNKSGELKKELARWHQKGKLGSTNLSGLSGNFEKGESGWGIIYNTAKDGESQNDIIYKHISQIIDRVENILDEEGLNITDQQLDFARKENEVFQNLDDDSARDLLKWNIIESRSNAISGENGIISGIFQDWNDLSNNLVSTKIELEELLKPEENASKTPTDIDQHIKAVKKSSKYKYVSEKLDSLRELRDSIVRGEKNDYYQGQLTFAMLPDLAKTFGAIVGKDQFSLNKFGKHYNDLLDEDKLIVDDLYTQYSSEEKKNVFKAYDIFFNLVSSYREKIDNVATVLKDYTDLFLPGYTEYSAGIENIENNIAIQKMAKSIEESKDIIDKDSIKMIDSAIENLEKDKKLLQQESEIQTLRSLSEKGENILHRSDVNADFSTKAQNYLNWINHLSSKNLFIEPEDYDFVNIVRDIYDHIIGSEEYLIQIIKDNFDDSETFISTAIDNVKYYISEFKNAVISKNYTKAKNRLKNLLQEIDDLSDYTENFGEVKSIYNSIVNPVFNNGISFLSFLEDSISIRSTLSLSPIHELLNDIISRIHPELKGIITNIIADIKGLSESQNMDDFVFSIPNAVENLSTIQKTIPIVYAMLQHDQIIPSSDSEYLSDNAKKILFDEFSSIYTKIDRLLEIAKLNSAQKLLEQEHIKVNMRSKFAKILIEPNSLITKNISKYFDFDLEKVISDIDFPVEVTSENYEEFEKKLIRLETELFSLIRSSNKSMEESIDILFGLFKEEDLIKRKPTKITRDPEEVISDYDKLIYLVSLIAHPSVNFYNEYSKVLSSLGLASIYSQEYVTKVAFSFINNKEILNYTLKKISDINKKSEDEYINSKDPLFNILPIISGGAGAGKTKAVDKILYELIKNKANVLTCAKTKKQLANLNDSLSVSGGFTVNDLLKEITGDVVNPKNNYEHKNKKLYPKNVEISKNNIFGDSELKVLFLDEYSLLDSAQIKIMSDWALKNNVLIQLSGDYKQKKPDIKDYETNEKIFKEVGVSGIEDWALLYLPELTSTIRAENIAKADNYTQLSYLLTRAYDYYFQNPDSTDSDLSKIIDTELRQNPIDLKYFYKDGSFSGGEIIVNSNDINSEIEKISKKTDSYIVIHNDPDKYPDDNHHVLIGNVQGDEYDYVVIDFNWRNIGDGNRNILEIMTDVYTLTQRSKKGTIMVNSDLFQNITSHRDDFSSAPLTMNQNQISRFNDKRIKELSEIGDNVEIVEFNIVEDENENENDTYNDNVKNDNSSESNNEPPITNDNDNNNESEISNNEKIDNTPEQYQDIPLPSLESYNTELPVKITTNNAKKEAIKHVKLDNWKFDKQAWKEFNGGTIGFGLDLETDDYSYKMLSAWFKYGYNKNDIKKLTDKLDNSKLFSLLRSNELIQSIEYVEFEDHTIIYGLFKSENHELKVPLFTTKSVITDNNFKIEVENKPISLKKQTNGNYVSSFGTLNAQSGFSVYSSPVVLHKDDLNIKQYSQKERKESNNYLIRNEGKTFIIISPDPFLSDEDFESYMIPESVSNEYSEESQVIQSNGKIRPIAVNRHAKSKSQMISAIQSLPKKDQNIVNHSTFASIIRALKSQFKNNNDFKELLIKVIGDKTRLMSLDPDNNKVVNIDEFVNLDLNKVEYLKIVRKTESGFNWDSTTKFISRLFNNESFDEIVDNLFKSRIFNQGIKINDVKDFNHIPGTLFGKVVNYSLLDYDYNISELGEQSFILIKEYTIENPNEEQNIKNERSEAEDKIKHQIETIFGHIKDYQEYNIYDIIPKPIIDVVQMEFMPPMISISFEGLIKPEEIGNIKIFSVYLQNNDKVFVMFDGSGNIRINKNNPYALNELFERSISKEGYEFISRVLWAMSHEEDSSILDGFSDKDIELYNNIIECNG